MNENENYFYMKFDEGQDPVKEKVIHASLTKYEVHDQVGDIIKKGAADRFMRETKEIPMFFQHNMMEVIGKWKNLRDEGDEMKADGYLAKGVQKADEAAILVRDKFLKGTSLKFRPRAKGDVKFFETDKSPYRMAAEFHDIIIAEASLVTNPANKSARIESFKSEDGELDLRAIERILCQHGLTRKEASSILAPYRKMLEDERKSEEGTLAGALLKQFTGQTVPSARA